MILRIEQIWILPNLIWGLRNIPISEKHAKRVLIHECCHTNWADGIIYILFFQFLIERFRDICFSITLWVSECPAEIFQEPIFIRIGWSVRTCQKGKILKSCMWWVVSFRLHAYFVSPMRGMLHLKFFLILFYADSIWGMQDMRLQLRGIWNILCKRRITKSSALETGKTQVMLPLRRHRITFYRSEQKS